MRLGDKCAATQAVPDLSSGTAALCVSINGRALATPSSPVVIVVVAVDFNGVACVPVRGVQAPVGTCERPLLPRSG